MSVLVLVRHGETALGSSTRYYGATDVALSEAGARQMEEVAERLGATTFERLYVSPLVRSRESGRLVTRGQGPRPEVVEAFREVDFGDWEGLTEAEIAAASPEIYAVWKRAGIEFRYPGGESRSAFEARVSGAARALFPIGCPSSLAVVHKGVIRVVLRTLLGPSEALDRLPIELGSIHRLDGSSGRWVVSVANPAAPTGF